MIIYLACLLIGYFFGCISSGYLVGKFHHVDIRQVGSGNAGTTNVLRSLGKLPALATFLGDIAKAIVPIVVIRILVYNHSIGTDVGWYLLCLYCGLGVVLGHNYPFYLGFKGGKGIAVTAAVIVSAAHPLCVPIGLALFIGIVVITRYVSLGSLVVAWIIPVNTILLYRHSVLFVHMLVISLLFTIFAYYQHRANIVRLFQGTENKLWGSSKEDKGGKV